MGLLRTVDPSVEPVTTTEAKKQAEVLSTSTEHDSQIDRMIADARDYVEQYIKRALITQTWRLTLSQFHGRVIELPRPPLQSVTSVKYYDANGTQQTLVADTDYRVDTQSNPGRVYYINGSWPGVDYDRLNAVEVIYVAGFGDAASDVPDKYKQIILSYVAHKFSNRGDENTHQTFRLPRYMIESLNAMRAGTSLGYYGVTS